jgi:hypothetical protein
MVLEDEILLCGLVLLAGILAGAIARLVFALRERRAA